MTSAEASYDFIVVGGTLIAEPPSSRNKTDIVLQEAQLAAYSQRALPIH